MTLQGVGAALSPALGGMLAQHFGYASTFLVLGAVSTGSLALWLLCGATLKKACGRHCENDSASDDPLTT
jgi:MFS family permease